jgi:DNA-binding protein YbaB
MNEGRRADEGRNRIAGQLNVSVPSPAPRAAVRPVSWGSTPGQAAAAASGQVSWSSLADAATAELQRRAADLEAAARVAAGRQYQARSADGSITVTVDGRARVTSVRISDEAAGSAPAELARALGGTVNSALQEARYSTQALLGKADPALQAWISDAAASQAGVAASVTSGTSADGSVTATVSRAATVATVLAIELPKDASRGYRQARLDDAVAEAVNAALVAGEQAGQQRLGARGSAPAPDPWSAGKAALAALGSRMDLLLSELDRIGSNLGG